MEADSGKRGYILIADDDPNAYIMLARLLSLLDWKTDHAANGSEALEKAASNPPALIMLDLIMPGMSGFETVVRLKQDERLKHIPIVIISSLGTEPRLHQLGVAGILPKSAFTRDRLIEVLDKVFQPTHVATSAAAD